MKNLEKNTLKIPSSIMLLLLEATTLNGIPIPSEDDFQQMGEWLRELPEEELPQGLSLEGRDLIAAILRGEDSFAEDPDDTQKLLPSL